MLLNPINFIGIFMLILITLVFIFLSTHSDAMVQVQQEEFTLLRKTIKTPGFVLLKTALTHNETKQVFLYYSHFLTISETNEKLQLEYLTHGTRANSALDEFKFMFKEVLAAALQRYFEENLYEAPSLETLNECEAEQCHTFKLADDFFKNFSFSAVAAKEEIKTTAIDTTNKKYTQKSGKKTVRFATPIDDREPLDASDEQAEYVASEVDYNQPGSQNDNSASANSSGLDIKIESSTIINPSSTVSSKGREDSISGAGHYRSPEYQADWVSVVSMDHAITSLSATETRLYDLDIRIAAIAKTCSERIASKKDPMMASSNSCTNQLKKEKPAVVPSCHCTIL